MTGQDQTPLFRVASACGCALACAVLAACSTSSPSNTSASRADASTTQPAARKYPNRSQSKKAAPSSADAPARAPGPAAEKPQASAKADRNYLRPASGAIVSRFDGRGNKGVDFGGAKGDPVRAVGDGKVVFASSTLRGYGRLVMIKHDATYMSAYAHNSELLVKEGQPVKRGQLIARMGNTESPTVKLHFELRRNGSAVDPMPFFAAEAADH